MNMLIFKRIRRLVGAVGILAVLLIAGCRHFTYRENSDVLFCQWSDESFCPAGSTIAESPNAKFSAEYSWEDPDTSDKQELFILEKESGKKLLVGRSTRGAKARWAATQLGDLLIVEHLIDTHFVESFVVYPQITGSGVLSFTKLYGTPDFRFYYGDFPPEHIYSSVKEISCDGIMTLTLTWDFGSQASKGRTMTLEIPLFYGAKVD